jgi:hypothetical protein
MTDRYEKVKTDVADFVDKGKTKMHNAEKEAKAAASKA